MSLPDTRLCELTDKQLIELILDSAKGKACHLEVKKIKKSKNRYALTMSEPQRFLSYIQCLVEIHNYNGVDIDFTMKVLNESFDKN